MRGILFLMAISLLSASFLLAEAKAGNELNFSRIGIEGVGKDDQCFFTISYDILIPKEKTGSAIPLLSGGIVRDYRIKRGKGSLRAKEDTYYLLVQKAGEFSVVVDYVRELGREGSWEYFALPNLPTSARYKVSFKIPHSEVNLKGKNHLMLEKIAKDGYVLISAFPRPGEKIELWWEKELKEKVEEKVQVLAQSTNSFQLYPNYWKLISKYELTIPSGKAEELSIRLKKDLVPVEVKGDGIIDWRISEGKLKILFSEGRSGKFPVTVTYEGFIEKLPSLLTLSIPPIESEIRHSGTMEVKVSKELESEIQEASQVMRSPTLERSDITLAYSYRFGTSEAYLKVNIKPLSPVVSYLENSLVHLDGEIEKIATDIKGEVKKTRTYALALGLPSGYRILNVEDSQALGDTVWDLTSEGKCVVSYPDGLVGKFHIRVVLEKEHGEKPQEYIFAPIVTEKASFEGGLLGIEDRDRFELKKMLIEGGYEIDPEKGEVVLGTRADRLIRLSASSWKISFTRFEVPVEMDVESSHLLEVAEGFIKGKGIFNYHLRRGRCQNFCLSLPPQAEKVSFKGLHMRSSTLRKSEKEQIWDIELASPVRGYYSLVLDYETKYERKDSDMLQVSRIQPLNIYREKGFIGVFTATGFEIGTGVAKGLWAAEVEEVPLEIKRFLPSPLLLAYRFTEKPYELSFRVIEHPQTALLEAMINKGKLDTVITSGGRELTHLLIRVYNKNEQFLEVGLPPESFMWHASVEGRVVRPARNPQGNYLLPLEKERTGGEGFEVEMVYVREKGIIQRDNLRLIGPAFSLPSSRIDWDLYLPEDKRFGRFKGNLTQVTQKGEKIRFSFAKYRDLEKRWKGEKGALGAKYLESGERFLKKKDYGQAAQQYQQALRFDARQKETQEQLEEAIVAQNVIADENLRRQGILRQERITKDQAKAITGLQIAQLKALTSTRVVLPGEGIKYSFTKDFMTSPGIPLNIYGSFHSRKAIFLGTLVALVVILTAVIVSWRMK